MEYPARHPLGIVHLYEQGIFTWTEAMSAIFERVTKENVPEFLDNCASEILEAIDEYARQLPADDDDKRWSQRFIITGATYCGPPISEELKKVNERNAILRERTGLIIFRAAMAKRKHA